MSDNKQSSERNLYLYDSENNMAHVAECRCVKESNVPMREFSNLTRAIEKRYKPCPECFSDIWQNALCTRNSDIVARASGCYFFFPKSNVFHRSSCTKILNADRHFDHAVNYETCINAGRHPCSMCNPVPGLFKNLPKSQSNHSLTQPERRAFERHTQAARDMERMNTSDMTDEEQKDLHVLTSTAYAFWAAKGFGTFHLRKCSKLNNLKDLIGFSKYAAAIRAGYQPCKFCKPTNKYDVKLSIPLSNRKRDDEQLQNILHLCENKSLNHEYHEPLLTIRTPKGQWRINVTQFPLTIDHMHTDADEYHRQHRMFLSVSDVIDYICRHDEVR